MDARVRRARAAAASCALALALAPMREARAGTMYVGAGDAAFLEREYVDLRYAGVDEVVPGVMDGRRGVRVTYDESKMTFETLMRTYWRHGEPTAEELEMGPEYAPVIYAATESEKTIAETARANLESSKIFGDKPLTVEVIAGTPKTFEESDARDALKVNPKKYEKLNAKRAARYKELWGFVQFCADRVCGYVRFAPKCVGKCLAVFQEYEARNAGIPELGGKNIKITSK